MLVRSVLLNCAVLLGLANVGSSAGEDVIMTTSSCPMAGMDVMTSGHETDAGYVVGWYGDGDPVSAFSESRSAILVPFAIGHCSGFMPLSGRVGMFTCDSDAMGFTFTMYTSTSQCSGQVAYSHHYNQTTLDMLTPFPMMLRFNCAADRADAYAQVALEAAGSTHCTGLAATYYAVDTCVSTRLPTTFESGFFSWYCKDTSAYTNFFTATENGCDSDALCFYSSVGSTCSYYASTQSGIPIYSKLISCSEMSNSETTMDVESGAQLIGTTLAFLVALVATLFH